MYRSDATHTMLMQADRALVGEALPAMDEGLWALNLLTFVMASHAAGIDPMPQLQAVLAKQPDRLTASTTALHQGKAACQLGAQALRAAREKIPDTTPPDPSGFECSRSAGDFERHDPGGDGGGPGMPRIVPG